MFTLVVAAPGCGGQPDPPAGPATPGSSAAAGARESPGGEPADDATVNRLRSLPYLGFTARSGGGAGVTRHDATRSQPGLNLYATANLCRATSMDAGGRVRHAWQESPCGRWSAVEPTPEGDLLVAAAEPSAGGDADDLTARRFLMRLSKSGERQWRQPIAAHHDIQRLTDGRLLTITSAHRVIPDVHASTPVRDNDIAILAPDGTELERRSLADLFLRSRPIVSIGTVKVDRSGTIDLFHANAVEPATTALAGGPSPGRFAVLVTIRNQDSIALVDWQEGRIVWAWGPGILSGPHDARLLENGHLLVFDNGLDRGWSRVIELEPKTRRVVWEYRAPDPRDFYTLSRGSSQRLPNGNTLIAQSDSGRAFEVTPDGTIVWEFWNPEKNEKGERATIVRIRRMKDEG